MTKDDLKTLFTSETKRGFTCRTCGYEKYEHRCSEEGDCIISHDYKSWLEDKLLELLNLENLEEDMIADYMKHIRDYYKIKKVSL